MRVTKSLPASFIFCGVRINLIQINAGRFASGGKADIAGSPSWAIT
jgi:hypothetical protein